MFRWAVVEELLPPSVHEALTRIGGIRKGSDPRVIETLPVKPVPSQHIAPVVACAIPQIATMIQVQSLPDEVAGDAILEEVDRGVINLPVVWQHGVAIRSVL